jgi:tetratricopeptide (TPR) repeat protein
LRELTTDPGQQIQEDFEEASFYYEQGLFAEAEAIYRRVLERAPSHPGALLRLGEIAVQRGEGPGPLSDPDARPVRSHPLDIEPPDALDLTTPTLDEDASRAWVAAIEPEQDPNDSTADVVESSQPDDDATETPPVPRFETAAPSILDEPELTTPDLGHGESPAGASFDLAAELSEAMTDAPAGGAGTDEDGFASLFRDFKRGVSQTLGEGDVETHFDLGIAYREMGLLEDAIGEFRYALGFPSRRLDALQLMGLCALDLGRAQDAVGHLEQALASPEIPAEREAPLRYELGRAYQALPDRARALETFRRVFELEPDFQDVEERVAELEQVDDPAAAANASAEEAEAYESFDDLVADAADTAPPAPVERFETFDDLVAEANDEPSAGSVADTIDADTDAAFVEASVVDDDDTDSGEPYAAEPISEAELEAEPIADSESESDCEPQPAEPATSTPRRRRKVSFV